MNREQLLRQLDRRWLEFKETFAGLPDDALTESGVVGDWSVKDILEHVTSWENEALKYLPIVLKGERPPRYSVQYGGIDAFNAKMTAQNRALSLAETLERLEETHRKLVSYVQTVPEEEFRTETRFRRRLRLDTYSHYPEHTKMILEWRVRTDH